MYKEKISAWVDAHKDEMIEDIFELCRINSEKMPEEEDMPFGPGAAECLDTALDMAEGYGFETLPSLGAGRRQIRSVPVSGTLSSLGPYWPEVGAV